MNTQLATRDIATIATTDAALVDEWLEHERAGNGASENTLIAYRRGLDVFAGWLRDQDGAGLVTPAHVVAFRDNLRERYAVQTVNLRLTAVRRFYAFLVNTNRLPFSPAASVKGLKRVKSRTHHKRDALANGEVVAVLDTCDVGTLDGIRDWCILSLMAYCGLRAVEVHRADIGDLRTRGDRLTLDVQGKGRQEKDEFVVIPPSAERAVRTWLRHRVTFRNHAAGDPLFVSLSNQNRGNRLGLRAIRGMVKRRYQDAGVAGEHKTTHSLRHSAITNAIRQGATPMQVQSMARHSSFDTTLGYYHEVSRVDEPAEDVIRYER